MDKFYCPKCGLEMYPVMFIEPEYSKHNRITGRYRRACSHLECDCGHREAVDGNYLAGPWETRK